MNKIINGDCLKVMQSMEENSIDCCVTSPPYYGLRDYGVCGQIGVEDSPEVYVNKLVEVFHELKRVLKTTGTMWLNLGDSYKNKQLMGIPWRIAFALQNDGWYLRQDIIWQKPNAMPESVKDRFTRSHEYIFLLSKSKTYHFDRNSTLEQSITYKKSGIRHRARKNGMSTEMCMIIGKDSSCGINEYRYKRSVWSVSTKCSKYLHYAIYPEDLITPCILSGCPEGGIVLDPFFGSGTTGVVCKNHNRKYIGIELNKEYCEIAEKRLINV